MKTRVQVLDTDKFKEHRITNGLINMRKSVVTTVVGLMRVFGIAKITTSYKVVGIKGLTDVSFKPMPITPPDDFLDGRNFMVRHLADMITLFGILEVEVTPTREDLDAIQEDWHKLQMSDLKIEINED